METIRRLLDARRWTREQAEGLILLMRQRPTVVRVLSAPTTWTNMPASVTPLLGLSAGLDAIPADLSAYAEARITGALSVPGAASAALQARFATSAPGVAASYSTLLAGASIATAGQFDSGWLPIPAASTRPGWVAVFGLGGDGAADPLIGNVTVWLR